MLKSFLGGVCLLALGGAAWAGDVPQYAPAPDWIRPQAIPVSASGTDGSATQTLLLNQQARLTSAGDDFYTDVATKVLSATGLSDAGSFIADWLPDTETITIHKVEIIRDGHAIDALAGGSKVTVLRREKNLESAALDGSLTATVQIEGLRVGDIVHTAYTLKRHDPVLHANSFAYYQLNRGEKYTHAFFRVIWPKDKSVHWKLTPGLVGAASEGANGVNEFLSDNVEVQAPNAPVGAPARYHNLAAVEFSDFARWTDVSKLMFPYYAKASTLSTNSPLRAEVAKIRAASSDPKVQTLAALQLVEREVRYLFLGMNNGGYIPADADLTWSRRFGDCKGKAALLLALLHELSVEAEPVLVDSDGGDGMDKRLPSIALFDHVIVRAMIGGQAYWLDATRLGDFRLERPEFDLRWVLPLRVAGAELMQPPPPRLDEPSFDSNVSLDATPGLDHPAAAHVVFRYSGEQGLSEGLALTAVSKTEIEHHLKSYWHETIPWITPNKVSFSFDPDTGVTVLNMDGAAEIDWAKGSNGRDFIVDDSALGWTPKLQREPGPWVDAPYAVGYPMFKRWTVTLKLPKDSNEFLLVNGGDVDTVTAGVRFKKWTKLDGGVATIFAEERAVAQEFPASEAKAAAVALRELADFTVVVRARPRTNSAENAATAELKQKLVAAAQKVQDGEAVKALEPLQQLSTDPGFARFTIPEQQATWALLAYAAQAKGDLKLSLTAIRRAVAIGKPTAAQYALWFQIAALSQDTAEEIVALEAFATKLPEKLAVLNDRVILQTVMQAKGEQKFKAMVALRRAHWTPVDPFMSASNMWLQLATQHLSRGDVAAAREAARDVTDRRDLIAMKSDRRFDPITDVEPGRYDSKTFLETNLSDLKTKSAAHPDRLLGVVLITHMLVADLKADEALAVIEAALEKARATKGETPFFKDQDERMGWALESRASVLDALGRKDDAVRTMERASHHAEQGGANVSQMLDLADFYNRLGRPADAIETMQDFDPRHASLFGAMVWKANLACAYSQLGDKARLADALAFLNTHVADGPGNLEEAQLCVGDLDAVAKTMIARLDDPETRGDTLVRLQDYPDKPHASDWEKQLRQRWITARSRPEVMEKIRQYGRIAAYPFAR